VPTQNATYRVYYEDTDAGGVVYHANYLKFAERARSDWLRAQGYEQAKLAETENIFFVVKSLGIVFHSPAKLDDLLSIQTELVELNYVSIKIHQCIKREDVTLATLDVTLACVGEAKKPTRWPAELYQHFRCISQA
jgi:acyl-CoA thioester hydrolase